MEKNFRILSWDWSWDTSCFSQLMGTHIDDDGHLPSKHFVIVTYVACTALLSCIFLWWEFILKKIILPDWLVSHWTYLCSSCRPDSVSWEILEFIQSVETRHGSQGFYISLVSCIFWILKCFEAIIQTSDNMWQIFQILHQHQ